MLEKKAFVESKCSKSLDGAFNNENSRNNQAMKSLSQVVCNISACGSYQVCVHCTMLIGCDILLTSPHYGMSSDVEPFCNISRMLVWFPQGRLLLKIPLFLSFPLGSVTIPVLAARGHNATEKW